MSLIFLPPVSVTITDTEKVSKSWYQAFVAAWNAINTPSVPSYTVATLPDATTPGRLIYVSDETGGAVLAFSDGSNWLRVTDRATVS